MGGGGEKKEESKGEMEKGGVEGKEERKGEGG